ncbi:ABC transporter ATP-binding protein [Pseudoalteromonas phenolica]|uniref:ABC transporter ATP-binding protein n=1 Tax=Pseudoalteromonas phenolica TaxID=161398 RepID=A0A0S2K6Y9_9GAMM|nr:ABC transporter ATP-binding protein [Pseudoalteromonas phenolica]ALO44124.1 ABC transporter ATP-binding protein [Pseudoalteromonas phenolica]MBE0357111.1 putative ABC transport system ATP-binding protein [Pseudoalteromonas phenolica O-BC30]RXE93396.1 ABC transporter ATP-binding protein [Pseudoalteromonas phenolica O-BC30]
MGIAINLTNLTHHIPVNKDLNLALLEDASLRIKAAEQVAIVGASGSGKTTLLSILAGLEPLQSGELAFIKQQVVLNSGDINQHSGFVFQQFHLIPELDALNNVALPLKLKGDKQAFEKARNWLFKVGLAERADFSVSKLSGGEQQRVAIARAFVSEPAIIFADEPTGNLDEQTAEHISQLMLQCCRETKATLVLITHNQALAEQLDTVYKLEHGRLQLCS